ncbi:MAG: hypothetical protein ACM3WT_08810, partial [Bacillota bacterium]
DRRSREGRGRERGDMRDSVGGGTPAARDHPELVRLAVDAITEVLGTTGAHTPLNTPGGEDFHEFPPAIRDLKTKDRAVGPGAHGLALDHVV